MPCPEGGRPLLGQVRPGRLVLRPARRAGVPASAVTAADLSWCRDCGVRPPTQREPHGRCRGCQLDRDRGVGEERESVPFSTPDSIIRSARWVATREREASKFAGVTVR